MSDFDLEALINQYNDDDDTSETEDGLEAVVSAPVTTDTPVVSEPPAEPEQEDEEDMSALSEFSHLMDAPVVAEPVAEPEQPEPVASAPVVVAEPEPDPEPVVALSDRLELDPDKIEATSLADAGLLVILSIGQWGNRKSDRKAAGDLAASKNAKATMVSVSKRLVASPTLKAIKDIAHAARIGTLYNLTMPWSDCGMRFLPGDNFQTYQQEMSKHAADFDAMVQKFRGEYALLREEARLSLGDMFDQAVYPPVDQVIRCFRFEYNELPVPERGDIRVDITDDAKKQTAVKYDKFYREQVAAGVKERWDIALDKVVWMIDRMTDTDDGKKKTFKEGALTSAIEIIGLLDTFNVLDDPQLTAVTKELRAATRNLDAKSLRDSEQMRRATKERLEKAIASLPGLSN